MHDPRQRARLVHPRRDREKGLQEGLARAGVTVDYGAASEVVWAEYTERRILFRVLEEQLPLFRRAIDASAGLFPSRWLRSVYMRSARRVLEYAPIGARSRDVA